MTKVTCYDGEGDVKLAFSDVNSYHVFSPIEKQYHVISLMKEILFHVISPMTNSMTRNDKFSYLILY